MHGGLLLRIADDGDGFDPSEKAPPGHLGLTTVTERAELAGGWCRVHSRPDEGAVLECWMPLGATRRRAHIETWLSRRVRQRGGGGSAAIAIVCGWDIGVRRRPRP